MAYTPINWQTGDTITAEKMNKMDNGWGFEPTQLFSESVTTADQGGMNQGTLAYSQTIDADTITVAFNGADYTCSRIDVFGEYFYGGFTEQGPDFSEFPFAIEIGEEHNFIYTQTAGTYTVAVSEREAVASDDFSEAVNMAVEPLISAIPTPFFVTLGTTTWGEVWDAMQNSKAAFVIKNNHIASQPVVFEPIIYIIRSGYKIHSIGTNSNGDGVELKTYSASSSDGVLS